jgi:hypothetical protein
MPDCLQAAMNSVVHLTSTPERFTMLRVLGSRLASHRIVAAGLPAMFFFFSNRLGCLGSLLLSAIVTVALLFVFGILRF